MNLRAAMVKKSVSAQGTRMGRAAARKEIGKLRHQVVSKKTEARYEQAYKEFLQFHKLEKYFTLPPFEILDDMVAEFVEYLWEDGQTKTQANYTLAAIQYFRPQAKQHLPWSWKLTKVWNQVEIPIRATPLDPDTLLAFAGLAFKWRQPIFGHLIILGFTLFLRTGEILQLSPADVTLGPQGGVVFISSSKGNKRNFLPLERLEVTEQIAVRSLRALMASMKTSTTFWTSSRYAFMKLWDDIVAHFGLQGLNYKPYSLRRGGASTAYKNGATLDQLVSKGRWQQVATARIYLDTGLQALTQLQIPPSSRPLLRQMAHYCAVSQSGARGKGKRT